jgi:hypothetical protein
MEEPVSTEKCSDDDWMENDVLVALDDEVDPLPEEWELDVREGYLLRGPEVWDLDRLGIEFWSNALLHRRARYERLVALEAPQIILDNELALVFKAEAGVRWQQYQRLQRKRAS